MEQRQQPAGACFCSCPSRSGTSGSATVAAVPAHATTDDARTTTTAAATATTAFSRRRRRWSFSFCCGGGLCGCCSLSEHSDCRWVEFSGWPWRHPFLPLCRCRCRCSRKLIRRRCWQRWKRQQQLGHGGAKATSSVQAAAGATAATTHAAAAAAAATAGSTAACPAASVA